MNTTTPDEKRGPGRPRKEESPRREQERRRRKGEEANLAGKLAVPPHLLDTTRFVYRWINDEQNGRIYTMTNRDDWDLVDAKDPDAKSDDLGAKFRRAVGSHKDGSTKWAYLARKPKTFYDEDKAAEQAALDEQQSQLRRGNDKHGAAQSDYVPAGGIRM